MTEEMTDIETRNKVLSELCIEFQSQFTEKDKQIEELKAKSTRQSKNYKNDVEGLLRKIAELEVQLEREKNLNQCMTDNNEQLRELIKKMKCCCNCEHSEDDNKSPTVCDKCYELLYWKLKE